MMSKHLRSLTHPKESDYGTEICEDQNSRLQHNDSSLAQVAEEEGAAISSSLGEEHPDAQIIRGGL